MATTLIDKQKTGLLKKFHTLCGRLGMDNEQKHQMLWDSYGVMSSKDLNAFQLLELCDSLDKKVNPEMAEMDKRRKRLMAAIGGWLKAMHMHSDSSRIKAIACRAAKQDDFNAIPTDRLRSLYYAFSKAEKDLSNVSELTAEMLEYLGQNN